jgi:protein arginine kinase
MTNLDLPDWLQCRSALPDDDVVIDSRLRLERNLADSPFPWRLNDRQRSAVQARLRSVLTAAGFIVDNASELDELQKSMFVAREFYPRPYLIDDTAIVALHRELPLWVMVNERNHLVLLAESHGQALMRLWRHVDAMDDRLAAMVPWAFDPDVGYILSNPERCGSGLSASCGVHLPALMIGGLAEKTLRRAMERGLQVSGTYALRDATGGHYFSLVAEPSIEESEATTLERLGDVVDNIVDYERRVRTSLLLESPHEILDIAGRALGRAVWSWSVSWDEAAEIMSGLRLGVACGIILGMKAADLTLLWVALRAANTGKPGPVRPAATLAGTTAPVTAAGGVSAMAHAAADAKDTDSSRRARILRRAAAGLRFNEEYRDV